MITLHKFPTGRTSSLDSVSTDENCHGNAEPISLITPSKNTGHPMNLTDLDRAAFLSPLLARYTELQAAIKALNEALDVRYVDGGVYQMPFSRGSYQAADGHDGRREIQVTPATGRHALRLAQRCFAADKKQGDQLQTKMDALPGYLITRNPDVLHRVAAVNAAKSRFKATILGLPAYLRFQHELFPGTALHNLMLAKVYRPLDVFDRPLRAVTFCWSSASEMMQGLSQEEVANLIAQGSAADKEALATGRPTEEVRNTWRAQLAASEASRFVRISGLAPAPCVWLTPQDEDASANSRPPLRQAVIMPLIFFCPGEPQITPLQSYRHSLIAADKPEPAVGHQTPSGRPLIEALKIYPLRPPPTD